MSSNRLLKLRPNEPRFQFSSFTGEAAVHRAEAVHAGKQHLVPDKARLKLFSSWLNWRLAS